ncbi:MAG: hypothetical protein NTW49_06175 [Bacteroidia bacterium]|nr:hypothetical protein [Bacteroidia bacterium]
MKKSIIYFIFIFAIATVSAQTPMSFSYQAVVRDSTGNILADQNVSLRISVLQGNVSGSAAYVETHATTTNRFGLILLSIGQGNVISGSFSNIDWASGGMWFLKVELDPYGGSNYFEMGTSQFLSVPYALHSKTAEILTGALNETDPVFGSHAASSINSADILNWNTAFNWGNHAIAGYLTNFTESDPVWSQSSVNYYTKFNLQTNGSAQVYFGNITNRPNTLAGYGITDAMNTSHPANSISTTNISHWNTAYSWGNHATAGYLATETDPVWSLASLNYYTKFNLQTSGSAQVHFDNVTNKPTTLNGYGITNAMHTSQPANTITLANISNWNTAYSWGNHADAGYLTYETDPVWSLASLNYYTIQNLQTSGSAQVHFDNITHRPTTLDGYGITDAAALHHTHNIATQDSSGFMSAADKYKLDTLEAQTLSVNGDLLSISDGNTVTIPHQNGYQVFTTSGTFTVPTGVTLLTIEMWGGGAGGSGNFHEIGIVVLQYNACGLPEGNIWDDWYYSGFGGGGGGYGKCFAEITTPGVVITVTVGSGGTGGGPNSYGTNGGNSSIATPIGGTYYTAYGGEHGTCEYGTYPILYGEDIDYPCVEETGILGYYSGSGGCSDAQLNDCGQDGEFETFYGSGGKSGGHGNYGKGGNGGIGYEGLHWGGIGLLYGTPGQPTSGSNGQNGLVIIYW